METTLIYIVILTVASLSVLLVGLFVAYLSLLRRYVKLQKEKYEGLGFGRLFDKTHEQLRDLLNTARLKIEEILEGSQVTSDENTKIFKDNLDKSMQIYVNSFNDALKESQDKAIKMLLNIPQDITGSLDKQLAEVRGKIESEIHLYLEEAKKTISEAYKNAEDEVEKYKNRRLKEVDDSIIDILQEIARKVLLREINQEEHEKLVMRALEEAKRNHFFTAGEENK